MARKIGEGNYVVATNAETGETRHFASGEDIPEEWDAFVGDHVTEDAVSAVGPSVSEQFDRPEGVTETLPAGPALDRGPEVLFAGQRLGAPEEPAEEKSPEEVTGEPPPNQDPVPTETTSPATEAPDYGARSVEELRAEVESRKSSGREVEVPSRATKAELVAALEADDQR